MMNISHCTLQTYRCHVTAHWGHCDWWISKAATGKQKTIISNLRWLSMYRGDAKKFFSFQMVWGTRLTHDTPDQKLPCVCHIKAHNKLAIVLYDFCFQQVIQHLKFLASWGPGTDVLNLAKMSCSTFQWMRWQWVIRMDEGLAVKWLGFILQ